MAVITPQTDLYLLKSPLSMNGNTLNFKDKTAQANYFLSLPRISADDFTYQRKDNVIRFPAQYDSIVEYNYCMYRNDAYSNKWFYAFITNMRYINDNMTEVSITTDIFQTWGFDVSFKQSFVEREHVSNDAIGAHTLPESLESGEYVVQAIQNWDYTGISSSTSHANSAYVCIGVTEKFDTFQNVEMVSKFPDTMNLQGGVTGGLTWLAMPNTYASINEIIGMYNDNSREGAITCIFIVPTSYINAVGLQEVHYKYKGTERIAFVFNDTVESAVMGNYTSTAPTNLAGYTPRNKKLLTYPYCYELVSNNGGSSAVYRWEDFTGRLARFTVDGTLSQGMSIKLYPTNYKSATGRNGWEWSLTGQKLPTCSWSTDFYVSWVNQQGANMANQRTWAGQRFLGAAASGAAGAASIGGNLFDKFQGNWDKGHGLNGSGADTSAGGAMGILGGIVNSAVGISNAAVDYQQAIYGTLQQQYEAEITPNEAHGNVNTGDVNFSSGKSVFTAYDMCIKPEYARVIDDYFDKYGYKVNRVEIPNIDTRQNWNYIKTIGCNLTGNCPQDDLVAFENLYNAGLTIWHNPATMYDYSQSNGIK